jgi:hypothetical protein
MRLLLSLFFLILSASGPSFGKLYECPQPEKSGKGIRKVLVLDTSQNVIVEETQTLSQGKVTARKTEVLFDSKTACGKKMDSPCKEYPVGKDPNQYLYSFKCGELNGDISYHFIYRHLRLFCDTAPLGIFEAGHCRLKK